MWLSALPTPGTLHWRLPPLTGRFSTRGNMCVDEGMWGSDEERAARDAVPSGADVVSAERQRQCLKTRSLLSSTCALFMG